MSPSQRAVPRSDDHENKAGSHKERPSQNDDFGKIALTSSLQKVIFNKSNNFLKPLSSDIPKSLSKVMPETSLNLATKERTLKDFEADNLKKYWNDKCRHVTHPFKCYSYFSMITDHYFYSITDATSDSSSSGSSTGNTTIS